MCACVLNCFSHVQLCATLCTVACQRPCSDSSATPSFPSQPEGKIGLPRANPRVVMDREAWRAAIHGVTKSRTRLSRGGPQTTSTRLYAGGELQGSPVWAVSVQPHRWQPTRLPHPWHSPGKNTGVGCHFLLQCRKVPIPLPALPGSLFAVFHGEMHNLEPVQGMNPGLLHCRQIGHHMSCCCCCCC